MHVLWNSLLRPAIDAVQPRVIVEIGTEDGKTTAHILESCATWNAVLHTIDPKPLIDVDAWKKKWKDALTVHKQRSLEALPSLPFPDVVLIDGDHNWYTVFHELKLLEQRAQDEKKLFPLVFLHDVGWPYARRDLYYDIDTIPAEHRRPHAKGGIVRGQQALSAHGLNAAHTHATEEGTAQNGVLTALEDFLKQTSLGLEMKIVPGFHGLGIVIDKEMLRRHTQLRSFFDTLSTPAAQVAHMELLETLRTDCLPQEKELERKIEVIEQYAGALKTELAAYAKDRITLSEMIEDLKERTQSLTEEANLLQTMLDRIAMSKSWRWTKPFRRMGMAVRSFMRRP